MTESSTTANTSRSETSTLEAVGVGQGRDDGLDDRVRAREEASKWLRGVATGVGEGAVPFSESSLVHTCIIMI